MSIRPHRWMLELSLVVGLLVIAAALRFARLDQLPPGLYHDEAYEGLDALKILGGQTPIYLTANNGREPLYAYLLAPSIQWLGRSPGAIRVTSAIVGVLTVLAAYWLGRAMSGPRVGWLTGVITATTVWTIHLSRLGMRMVTLPLLIGLFLWQGGLAYRTGKLRHWVASGILYGASFYTYLAARATPLALLVFGVYLLATRRARPLWPGLVGWVIAATVVIAPLAAYTAGHWDVAMGRAEQTALVRPESPVSGVLQVLRAAPSHLGMFVSGGDPVPRHNIPSRSVFDPLMAAVFVASVLLCLIKWRQAPFAFALIWTAVMLLPSALSSSTPSFTRSTGMLPVAFAIPALGLDAAWTWISRRARRAAAVAIILLVAISASISARDYFWGPYSASQAAYDAFSTSAVEMAVEVNRYVGVGWQGQGLRADKGQAIPGRTLIIDRALWNYSTGIRYLVLERPDRSPDTWFLDTAEARRPAVTPQTKLIVTPENYQPYLGLLPHPSLIRVHIGPMAGGFEDIEPFRLYLAFTTEPPPNTSQPIGELSNLVRLQDATGQARCKQLDLELAWVGLQRMDNDYTAFVHVREGEQLIAQSDDQPASGFYPTSWWQPGDWIADARSLDLSAPLDLTRQRVTVGMYRLESGVPKLVGAPIDITGRIERQCDR